MFTGLVLIVTGILIAVYPPLLSVLVAGLLIFFGTLVLVTAYYGRKARGRPAPRLFEILLRY
ncbi:MAG TPA: hypothetical protein ENK62_00230 [Chromatiales bacterium]|nr:hypothetical protein [Chromatiales bacterium]